MTARTAPTAWLDVLHATCVAVEELTAGARLDAAVPWCAGADVAGTLCHVGVVHRLVRTWVAQGHRPSVVPVVPDDVDPREWFAAGWPPLLDTLGALGPDAETSTWCSYHTTASFWWRRMLHETVIHAIDVLEAVGQTWPVPEEVAVDGVDEALRLWLGVALGPAVGGSGQVVRLVAPQRSWTVGLNDHNVEVNHLQIPADATAVAPAEVLYRWLWGRAADDAVTVGGDAAAVAALRAALTRAMQ